MAETGFESMTPEQMAQVQVQNCIFCKIIKNEIPARKVYEDNLALCIMDIYPAAKGHLLLMPKEHYPFLPALDSNIAAHLYHLTSQVGHALKNSVVTDKATVFVANGAVAGQQSPHFLIHIIPREKDDLLTNFDIPAVDAPPIDLQITADGIKQRVAAMAVKGVGNAQNSEAASGGQNLRQDSQQDSNHSIKAREIIRKEIQPPELPQSHIASKRFSFLAKIILENPGLKKLLEADPEGFLREIRKYPDIEVLFQGIDIHKLAATLKQAK